MASVAQSQNQSPIPQNNNVPSASAKKRNKKKKSAAAKAHANAAAAAADSTSPSTPSVEPAPSTAASDCPDDDTGATVDDGGGHADEDPTLDTEQRIDPDDEKDQEDQKDQKDDGGDDGSAIHAGVSANLRTAETNGMGIENGHTRKASIASIGANGHVTPPAPNPAPHPAPKLAPEPAPASAMAENGSAPDNSVEWLRKQVEELLQAQAAHKEETDQLRAELEESEAGREQAETQYQNLLGRVEKIKETLGERLKRDKQELEEANDRIEELESQNETLRHGGGAAEAAASAAEDEVVRLREQLEAAEREQASLRGRSQLAQQNWQREKEDLVRQQQQMRAELESTSGAMGEWEVIAMEERSVREGLAEKAADLEEQLVAAREVAERVAEERETQARAVDGLQRALQEIQEARKRELREMVESSEAQLQAARKRTQEAEAAAEKAEAEAQALRVEVERTTPFEREVKEKNLLIGKLRHETIVLNDHLTKALRYIKKNKPEENVDRQMVTNHLLQFLALDRSDPKKFQILQIIAGVLDWTDDQKEKAGLARPGTSGNSLRLPSSPFHRTPSTPSLNAEFFSEPGPGSASRESLAYLWAGFLERSVEEATSETSAPSSRKGSLPRS